METEGPICYIDYNFKNAEEKSAEERAIDEWLPVTASRNGKWWYSAVHNVTVIVGAGILGLPSAMSKMGWGPGVAFMVVSWVVTLYTLWEMIEMHEMVPGKRFNRYHELGQHAFGEKLGLWVIVPQQLIVVVGVNIVYMVTAGECLKKFHDLVRADAHELESKYAIMIFASAHFVLSQSPSLNAIVRISLAAAIMTLGYSTIAWGGTIYHGVKPDVQYGYKPNNTGGTVLDFFSALGNVVFAYSAHNIVLEIQASMPSTPTKPSKGPMWRGALVAYIVVALCYFPVAFIGYGMFGNSVEPNILTSLDRPKWLIAMGNMFLVLHLIGSYQVFAIPFFDMMEIVLVKKFKFKATWYLRFISRNIYVAFTMYVAITFPFYNAILGFFGGFGFAPTTYVIPCMMWIAIHKPRRFSPSWFANWACIIFGVVLTIVGPIGGVRQIVLELRRKGFKLFRD